MPNYRPLVPPVKGGRTTMRCFFEPQSKLTCGPAQEPGGVSLRFAKIAKLIGHDVSPSIEGILK